jgi:uncharacterized integral membrane protein
VNTIRNLFYVLVGAVLAIFIYFNFDQRVVIYFTGSWHTTEIPLSLALFGSLLLGFLVAAILAIGDQIRLRSRLRQMRRNVERLESELGELRRLPLGESLPTRTAATEPQADSEPEGL